MAKWSKLKGVIEPFALDSDFQAKVNSAKEEYIGFTAAEMAKLFAAHRNGKRELEIKIKKLNIVLEALSQLLVENLETSQLQKMQLDTGETVYLNVEPYTSISDRSLVVDYMLKHKQRASLTVVWQTLNAMNKERLTNGQPALPGTQVFLKTAARCRGGNEAEDE